MSGTLGGYLSTRNSVVLLYPCVCPFSSVFVSQPTHMCHSFVLYMKYYPSHLKHEGISLPTDNATVVIKSPTLKTEWRLSIVFSWLTAIHLYVFLSLLPLLPDEPCISVLAGFITFFVLITAVPSPSPGEPLPPLAYSWAKFLGISAAVFASIQYAPQLIHTYRSKLVGALSIPMMCIQTPGGVLMVLSIALRPGTNWTSMSLLLRSRSFAYSPSQAG